MAVTWRANTSFCAVIFVLFLFCCSGSSQFSYRARCHSVTNHRHSAISRMCPDILVSSCFAGALRPEITVCKYHNELRLPNRRQKFIKLISFPAILCVFMFWVWFRITSWLACWAAYKRLVVRLVFYENDTIKWHRTIYVFAFQYEHVSHRNFDPINIESNVHLSLLETFVRRCRFDDTGGRGGLDRSLFANE